MLLDNLKNGPFRISFCLTVASRSRFCRRSASFLSVKFRWFWFGDEFVIWLARDLRLKLIFPYMSFHSRFWSPKFLGPTIGSVLGRSSPNERTSNFIYIRRRFFRRSSPGDISVFSCWRILWIVRSIAWCTKRFFIYRRSNGISGGRN